MLELICHHTYDTWPEMAIDRSTHDRSSGESVGATYLEDGAQPGSGALDLGTAPSHRVHIPTSDAWRDLGAIKGELVVRFGGVGDVTDRTLIDGDGSFQLNLVSQGSIGPSGPQFLLNFHLRISDPGLSAGWTDVWTTPDTFLNRWLTVGSADDGVDTIQITVDGENRVTRQISSPLRPVGSCGVSIGQPWTGPVDNRPLLVDEVRIRRRDPNHVHRVFPGRPLTPASADCLARAFTAIRDLGDTARRPPPTATAPSRANGPASRSFWRTAGPPSSD